MDHSMELNPERPETNKTGDTVPAHTNRLADETSPYLLQHAHNPVDWYPWGAEALERAKETDRPIFLSVGYAACHWCHVMERESFEDDDTAEQLNASFVSIKVDREERPDIDAIYMEAVQAMTGSGGWPMSVFLTPDGRPFYGGTYFPDEPRHGMPSFRQLLARISQVWRDDRNSLDESATKLADHIRSGQEAPARLAAAIDGATEDHADEQLKAAVGALSETFDPGNGGWGSSPKFPQSMTVEFLLREHLRTGDGQPLAMAERTLDAMAAGGIYDHLGGGFARYATDASWLIPHFEKMLYDNAQLARVYLHGWQVTAEDRYREVVTETLDFVARELRNPDDGAFASSLDADTEGEEGQTYVWDAAEIRAILGDDAPLFEAAYGVADGGNWEGQTIVSRVQGETVLASRFGIGRESIEGQLADARTRLKAVRDERTQPGRDDKVLTSWNGLMIAAFAEAGQTLQLPRYTTIATEAADFILREMRTADGRLLRSWKDGKAQHAGVLEDHAHLADGLLALYEATFDERWFVAARELMEIVLEHFSDDDGFLDTADDAEALIARPRGLQDNALPSGNAMTASVLLRLAALTGDGRYQSAAETAIGPIAGVAAKHPTGFGQWLQALGSMASTIDEVAIVGDPADGETQALLDTARARYRPTQVIAVAGDPSASAIELMHDRERIDGQPTAYVCHGFACQRPVTEPDALAAQLGVAAT
jgi:uncharacterized protein YyaL (SSP411 family)